MSAKELHPEGMLKHDGEMLHLPDEYVEYGGGVVIRTPTATVDAESFPFDSVGGTFPFAREHWASRDDDTVLNNPSLAPDKVSIKRYGEEPTIYTVRFDGDADAEGDR